MTTYEIRNVWRSADAAIERDVLAFWRRNGLLPKGADAAQRLAELCLVAYDGATVVAVLTAELRRVNFVRSRIALVRLGAPASSTQTQLKTLPMRMMVAAKKVLEEWSLAHPKEKVMGMGAIIQFKSRSRLFSKGIWPLVDLALVSYTPRGQQFRIAWFKHATVE